MKIKRPLMNPSAEDFEDDQLLGGSLEQEYSASEHNYNEEVRENVNSKEQLRLNINNPINSFFQRLSSFKMNVQRKNEIIELSAIWKTPALPFALVSMLGVSLYLIVLSIFKFDKIPPKIPVIYNAIEKHWEQSDKSVIIVGLVILLIIEGLIISLNMKIFPKDRRLGLTLNWILTLLNIFLLIYIIQVNYLIG